MSEFFLTYQPLLDLILIGSGYAFSQYLFLRAGSFSVATAGLAAVGAYAAAWLVMKAGGGIIVGAIGGTAAGALLSSLLAIPLAKLRGVYQAIATIAFVEIVSSLVLFAESITGGAMGLNGIPKLVDTWQLVVAVAAVLYMLHVLGTTSLGRAWDAIREDEAVAVSLGVHVAKYRYIAFAVSGAISGLFGALEALHGYALSPQQFGFPLLVAALSYVVLGGRRSPLGPFVGAALLIILPEVSRGFADMRMLVYGVLLVCVITFMPKGVVDTLLERVSRRKSRVHQSKDGNPTTRAAVTSLAPGDAK